MYKRIKIVIGIIADYPDLEKKHFSKQFNDWIKDSIKIRLETLIPELWNNEGYSYNANGRITASIYEDDKIISTLESIEEIEE